MEILYSTPTCLAESTVLGLDKIAISMLFFSLAAVTFFALKKDFTSRQKIALIYAHLSFLFFPFMLLTANTACGYFCMSCHNNIPALVSYAVPATLAASVAAGLAVIPAFYTLSGRRATRNKLIRRTVRTHSPGTKAYIVDKARPVAFSFSGLRPSIFLSAGLFDILNRKEIEAVVLHEIAHIRQKSSLLKFSALLLRFSPLSLVARFDDTGRDEAEADEFAASTQGTGRHLKSAKRKIDEFCGHL